MGTGGRGGLEDIVVSTSDICFIDGKEGRLVYRGYDVNDLVEHSSFEEVIFLLWHGGLPSRKELVAHTKALNSTEGQVKILADAKTDRLLGMHILGPRASDIIAEGAVAIEFAASCRPFRKSNARATTMSPIKTDRARLASIANRPVMRGRSRVR